MNDNTEESPHHIWGEEGFDWAGLGDCCHIVAQTCRRWGRLGVHTKEKYGTLRASTWWWDGSLHQLLYPGYVYCQYANKWWGLGKKLWWLDIYFWPKIANATGFRRLVLRWQKYVYNRAYQTCLRRYPHLKNEILVDADAPDAIVGGREVHDKFWVKVTSDDSL